MSRLISSPSYQGLRHLAKEVTGIFPEAIQHAARKVEHLARDIVVGGTLFEQLALHYVGPIDGHNLDHLLPVLQNVRDGDIDGRC